MKSLRHLAVLGLVLPVLATACGTTVPQAGGSATGNQGGGSSDLSTGGTDTTSTTGSSTTGGTSLDPTGTTGTTSDAGSTGTSSTGGSTGTTSGTSGGGTSGGSSTSGSSTGGTTGGATGPRVTTPLKVGIITTDIGAAVSSLGGSSGSSQRADAGYRAIISAINAAGGLSGRKLVPTYEIINALDGSYQQDGDAACAAFKDAKVEVVLSDSASTDYGFAGCLAKGSIPMITSVPSDKKSQAAIPALFNAFNPTFDRGYGAVVDQLVASGYVTTKSKIGVVRITCAAITAAYNNTVIPRMRAAHLATPIEYTVSCASGFQDAGAYSAAMQSAVLKFRASGVDRVFVMGSQENLLLQYFAEQAQSQQYHPGYALSSSAAPITLIGASTFPAGQLAQVHGVGWHPAADANIDAKLPQEKRCVSLSTKGGLKPKDIVETYAVYQACSNLFLLEAAVKAGDGRATSGVLRATIPTLGTSFASTGILGGTTMFGPGRQDGPQLASEWKYVSSCGCFHYLGQPHVMR